MLECARIILGSCKWYIFASNFHTISWMKQYSKILIYSHTFMSEYIFLYTHIISIQYLFHKTSFTCVNAFLILLNMCATEKCFIVWTQVRNIFEMGVLINMIILKTNKAAQNVIIYRKEIHQEIFLYYIFRLLKNQKRKYLWKIVQKKRIKFHIR